MNRIEVLGLIEKLSNANGVSGFEDEVVQVIREYADSYTKVKEDSFRNLYLYRANSGADKPIVMLDGHSDEVGFMVQSIKANGMIKFVTLGGWIAHNIPAQRVRITNSEGKDIIGVVVTKPPHFMSQAEREKNLDISDLTIDIGATSREEVLDVFKIELGAPIIPDTQFKYNEVNEIMLGKAFDNRLGCALVAETMKELKDEELDINLIGAVAAQEEVGLRGAAITSNTVKPDVAIVFEGTPADDTFRDKFESQASLKKGPQIRHRDKSMISNPRFTKFAREIAKELDIDFQDAVRISGGTNGGRIHLSNSGIPTIVIGIPVRYIHTHQGFAAIQDFEKGVKWAVEIIKRLDKQVIESF